MGSSLLGLFASLAITFGVLAISMRLLRRLQSGSLRPGSGVPLRVLQRAALGPKQGVSLVQVGDRVLVVSVGDTTSRLLTELEGDALSQALKATEKPALSPIKFKLPVLARFGLVAALCLAPMTLQAQQAPVRKPADSVSVPTPAAPAPSKPAARGTSPIQVQGPTAPQIDIKLGSGTGALQLSGTVGLVVFMSVLTLLPALFLLMTSFTRILIVLHFLRSALGTQTAPPNQLLVAVAVLLTGVIMNPVLQETNRTALQPYFDGQIAQGEAYTRALQPFRAFMLANTREQDLTMMTSLSRVENVETEADIPTVVVVTAFVISELRTAFQMGFVIFLPFVVVDLVVASVLMSMGMFMLPPMMISLPFKLLLFVLADGWTLVVQNLVASFR
jgi:flagellar biosynthesis protein FliP